MSQKFYTNFSAHKGKLYIREWDNNREHSHKIPISPSLYYVVDKESDCKSIYGDNLVKLDFNSGFEAKDWLKQYENQKNKIFGYPHYEYVMINEMYEGNIIDYVDLNQLLIGYVDIEHEVEGKNATPLNPTEKINLISYGRKGRGHNGEIICWGWGDAKSSTKDAKYIKVNSEAELLMSFLTEWRRDYPNAISGWFSSSFDLVYIINRMNMIIGEDLTKTLSPFGVINQKMIKMRFGTENLQYQILGIDNLDYMEVYRKFQQKQRESYKLDYIAEVELKDNKIAFDGTFKEFYDNHYQLFVDYNIHDVRLVMKLEDKLGYIAQAYNMAYQAKANACDVFGTVRIWDVLIANRLAGRNVHVPYYSPPKEYGEKYGGGYVKDPAVGVYEYVASIDATSLYPSNMRAKNTSPETLLNPMLFTRITPDDVLYKTDAYKQAIEVAKKHNAVLTPNGAMFSKEKQGIIPELAEYFFNQRVVEKNKGKKYASACENIDRILKSRGVK